ncbi:divalent metal cation transporter [Rhizobium altiplani]|uniref:divalent metal cation transporter n=1 Tax=Rhizobium altiplani TaxID=1864509 RepID=UPI002477EB69|nr:divalent metal cation transporter [Rhizobium altiplani]
MNWREVALQTVTPQLDLTGETVTMVVAVFGTTISPYLLFWQASEEVEDDEADPTTDPLIDHPEQALVQLSRIRRDTYIGMAFANLVAFFIILTTAVTLHGQIEIETSADAAEALRPRLPAIWRSLCSALALSVPVCWLCQSWRAQRPMPYASPAAGQSGLSTSRGKQLVSIL